MRKKKEPRTEVISFKITKKLSDRVDQCADGTGMARAAVAEMALKAAVDAIEANDGKLVVPIEFNLTVKNVPAPAGDLIVRVEPKTPRPGKG